MLLSLPSSVRIFLAHAPVDFRKSHDGLHAIVREQFGDDPLSGHVFVFLNRRVDRVKLLVWDRNGFWGSPSERSTGAFRFAFGEAGLTCTSDWSAGPFARRRAAKERAWKSRARSC